MATISHLRHFVLAVGFLLLAAPGASALQYKRLPLDAPLLGIAVTGPIVSGDLDRLGPFLKTLPKQDEELHPGFFVDSPGGDIFEAEKIATLINKFAASVVIPSGSQGQ